MSKKYICVILTFTTFVHHITHCEYVLSSVLHGLCMAFVSFPLGLINKITSASLALTSVRVLYLTFWLALFPLFPLSSFHFYLAGAILIKLTLQKKAAEAETAREKSDYFKGKEGKKEKES